MIHSVWLEISPLGCLFQVSFLLVDRDVDPAVLECRLHGQDNGSTRYPTKLAFRKGTPIYDGKRSLNAGDGSRVSGFIYGSEELVVNMRTR